MHAMVGQSFHLSSPTCGHPFLQHNQTQDLQNKYLAKGNTEGFRIGFRYLDSTTISDNRNMPSALANPILVTLYIQNEVEAG